MHINRGPVRNLQKKFDEVFQFNLFRGESSRSGNGSSIEQTLELANNLPKLFDALKIKSVLDIPCGDLEWMSQVRIPGLEYHGADVAPSLIAHLKSKYPEKSFSVIDIVSDEVPKFDLVFCRDLFVHLSNHDIQRAIGNLQRSGSKYLATTTFTDRNVNKDIQIFSRGIAWRTLNLEQPPFNFPKPIYLINEKCTENNGAFKDKCIAVWEIDSLNFG